MHNYEMTWDLSFFSIDLDKLYKEVSQLQKIEGLEKKILLFQDLFAKASDAESYCHCRFAQNTTDSEVAFFLGKVKEIQAELEKSSIVISENLRRLSDKDFEALLSLPSMKTIAFALREKRGQAKEKLPLDHEGLITDLSIDGYHGLSEIYQTLHSHLLFKLDSADYSFSQIDNFMHVSDRATRVKAFESYLFTFQQNSPLFAQILNHLAGFRLNVYKQRNIHDVLHEPLECNRLKKSSLMTMWSVVNKQRNFFVEYLRKKASLLGLEKLSWHDIESPLFVSDKKIAYQEGCELIITALDEKCSSLGNFCRQALTTRTIEAEDRKHKAGGGFCVGFNQKKLSRIFLTYSGTESNLSTLAHELGHAYHNEKIFHHPFLSQQIKMNVAECASTMFEILVSNYLLKQARTKEEKLAILDEKISRSIAFFLNIQTRFIFEQQFYEKRKKGFVSEQELCELMILAQKECYQESLDAYNPLFWASKMHFYFTDVPFYNFPYTFGYLFSLSLTKLLEKSPKDFAQNYNALLNDTPLMNSEDLIMKHFGLSLYEPTFWEIGMEEATKDVKDFMELM